MTLQELREEHEKDGKKLVASVIRPSTKIPVPGMSVPTNLPGGLPGGLPSGLPGGLPS